MTDGRAGDFGGPSWLPTAPEVLAAATVLVVDDQAANIAVLERLLRLAGVAQVHGLTDSRDALQRCIELRPDLLVLDLHMPHIDGFAVLESLRARLPETAFLPVLVVTADATPAVRDRALRAGARDFLTKPFDRAEVILRASNLLEMRALYGRLEDHNAQLRLALDARLAEERRIAEERRRRADRIRQLFSEDRLTMVFQPIVALATGEVVGVEALTRFSAEPQLSPETWFADAREVGLDTELELRSVKAALDQLPHLPDHLFMTVNLSPAVIVAEGAERVFTQVDGRRVVLELTEHTRVNDYPRLFASLDSLRYQGVRVAVDDAGSGYAGLHHILQLQPDILKIDIDLIGGLERDSPKRALVRALVAFADDLGAKVVAEGIETTDELDVLRGLKVEWGQGYLLGRPAPLPLSTNQVELTHPPANND